MGRYTRELQGQDVEVLVIGPGRRKEAELVARLLKLPMPVLADPDRSVYHRYGLDMAFLVVQRSGTFLIDLLGIVRFIQEGAYPRIPEKDELMREISILRTT